MAYPVIVVSLADLVAQVQLEQQAQLEVLVFQETLEALDLEVYREARVDQVVLDLLVAQELQVLREKLVHLASQVV